MKCIEGKIQHCQIIKQPIIISMLTWRKVSTSINHPKKLSEEKKGIDIIVYFLISHCCTFLLYAYIAHYII